MSPRASAWAPIWNVKNGVATHGYASTATSTTRCRTLTAE